MRGKWDIKNKKGYLKIHVAVTVKTKKILSMKVTDKHIHNSKEFPVLIENIIKSEDMMTTTTCKLFADGAYYKGNEIFGYLDDNGRCLVLK